MAEQHDPHQKHQDRSSNVDGCGDCKNTYEIPNKRHRIKNLTIMQLGQ